MLHKNYPVFDCDAHVMESHGVWDYVAPKDRELVRNFYYADEETGDSGILNGRRTVLVTARQAGIVGPGINQNIIRALAIRGIDEEQRQYLTQQASYEPHSRIKDMDVMGIDQVLVIPTTLCHYLYYIENAHAA